MLHDYAPPEQRFVATPNQDVAYGFGILSLDREPVVVQVPDFGDRFWVYQTSDQRTDGFGELGQMYGTTPGFYLLVGPDWDGVAPDGIVDTVRSPTNIGALIPRVFMDDTAEDRQAVLPLVSQVMAYPLSEFTGLMQTKDWTQLPSFPAPTRDDGGAEVQRVNPDQFSTFCQRCSMSSRRSMVSRRSRHLCDRSSSTPVTIPSDPERRALCCQASVPA